MTRRYLIVDDNKAFAENLAEILSDEGSEVTVAAAGADALELVAHIRFDALVTDMRMPVMGGAQLVHEIRQIDPDLPAIVVTAYTNEEDLVAARHEGLLAILPKPVPIERLTELLLQARRGGLVVLVDDDVALADNLAEILRTRGFSAVSAHSVAETERLGPVTPFVALADLRMPGGSDGDAVRMLGLRFPGLPILVVTAHGESRCLKKPLPTFEKPFDSAALLRTVEGLYDRSLS